MQGVTLDYVKVSLSNIFAMGQCYVALSRASSLAGLQVIDYDPNCVKVVLSFIQLSFLSVFLAA